MKTPIAVSIAVLVILSALHPAHAENVMQNGGFEEPAVKLRTPKDSGGDPANGGVNSLWQSFTINSDGVGHMVSAGLTNEIAHTGAQSVFVKFDDVTRSYQNATLETAPVPVIQTSLYRIGIWGRLDKKNPLTLGERIAFMRVQIEFFKDDGTTSAGDAEYRIQPIPGSKNRLSLFTVEKWNEYSTEVTTPVEADFMVVKLIFETGSTPGHTNGIIFFDDFTINGEPSPLKTPKPKMEDAPESSATTNGTSTN